jgi:hypothetical protein
MIVIKATDSCKMSVHGVVFQKRLFFIVTAVRTQYLTVLYVFENRVLTSTLTAKIKEWQSVGRSADRVTATDQHIWETRCIQLYGVTIVGDSGGRLPQNAVRMQGVTSQIIFFVSSVGTSSNITETRAEITLQSTFGHDMEQIHRLGSCAMCNECCIMMGNRPSDSATSYCWQAVRIRRPAILIMWYDADWTDLAQERVL